MIDSIRLRDVPHLVEIRCQNILKLTCCLQHIPSFSIQAPEKYLGTAVALMSRQASGEVTLQTSDPSDPPRIDPKFLDHPFDRRVAIDAVRETLDFLDTPGLAEDRERIGSGPYDRTDEEILVSTLHMYQRYHAV